MRFISTILLLSIIFLQTFSSFVIRAEYFLNKSYIARVLCINKNKPETQCHGKCYLTKKLNEQENQEQQAPNLKIEKFEMQPYFLPKALDFSNVQIPNIADYHNEDEMLTSRFSHAIFHPPTA